MEMIFAVILWFGLTVPSTNTVLGYEVVPCAVSKAGKITVRETCGFLPVSSIDGGQPVPDPYASSASDG